MADHEVKARRLVRVLTRRAVPPILVALASPRLRRADVLLPLAALTAWTAAELLVEDDAANAAAAANSEDAGSRYAVLGTHLTAWWVPVVLGWRSRGPTPSVALGVGSILAGGGLRVLAVHTLGARFTGHVRVMAEQPVCTSGPYAYVRHPAYSGLFGLNVGPAISCGSPFGSLVMAAATAASTFVRVRIEERALSSRLGAAYDVYARRTPRFVPAIRRARTPGAVS